MQQDRGKPDIKRILPVMKKEFLHIVRDARSLFIIIIIPVILLVLYAYAVTFDIRMIDMGLVDYDNSKLSREIAQKFSASGYFEIRRECMNNMEKCIKALRVNKIKMILVIPDGFSTNIKRNKKVKIQVLCDGSDTNTVSVGLGYAATILHNISKNILLLRVKSRGFNPKIIPAVEPVPRIWYNPELKSVNNIVPGLSAIIMMLIAALLTSLTIVREKDNNTFEQLASTPLKSFEIMLGKIIPYIVLCLIDVAIIFIVGILWFKVPFKGNYLTLFVFSVLFLFCSLGMGLLISSAATNQQIAVIGTAFSTLLPSILLSGFVFPINSMPFIIQTITYIVPARHFITALRTIFLKADTGIMTLWSEALFLFIFSVIFIGLAVKNFRKDIE